MRSAKVLPTIRHLQQRRCISSSCDTMRCCSSIVVLFMANNFETPPQTPTTRLCGTGQWRNQLTQIIPKAPWGRCQCSISRAHEGDHHVQDTTTSNTAAKMAKPQLKFYLDIVSPFAYMAFYVTRVSLRLHRTNTRLLSPANRTVHSNATSWHCGAGVAFRQLTTL